MAESSSFSSTRFLFLLGPLPAAIDAICNPVANTMRVNSESISILLFSASHRKVSLTLIISVFATSILASESENARKLAARSSIRGVSQLSESRLGGLLESSLSRSWLSAVVCSSDKIPASQANFRRFSPWLTTMLLFALVGVIGSAIIKLPHWLC